MKHIKHQSTFTNKEKEPINYQSTNIENIKPTRVSRWYSFWKYYK